jgi:hypothetical protein
MPGLRRRQRRRVTRDRAGVDRTARVCGPSGPPARRPPCPPPDACSAHHRVRAARARDDQRGRRERAAADLRSPDARDAAAGRDTFNSPDVSPPQSSPDRQCDCEPLQALASYHEALRAAIKAVNVAQPAPVRADDGLDWRDAGVNAGVNAASLLSVIGSGSRVPRRPCSVGAAGAGRRPPPDTQPRTDANTGPARADPAPGSIKAIADRSRRAPPHVPRRRRARAAGAAGHVELTRLGTRRCAAAHARTCKSTTSQHHACRGRRSGAPDETRASWQRSSPR